MDDARPRLTLIHGKKRVAITAETFADVTPNLQKNLFADTRPGIVVFVCFPDVDETEFVNLLENAHPRFVIDFRIAPRFDVGRLNRDRAFHLFDSAGAQYIDLGAITFHGAPRDEVMRAFSELLSSKAFDLSRPVVFLFSRPEASVASDSDVLSALASSGKTPKEIMQVPA